MDGQIVEAPLKTKNSYRTVSISPQAVEVLEQQKAKTNDEYVFPSPNGGPISPDSVNNMLKRVLNRAGILKVRFHDLHHTFATIAPQNGVGIKTVSGILCHFSAGFTLDTLPMSPQPYRRKQHKLSAISLLSKYWKALPIYSSIYGESFVSLSYFVSI